VRIRVTRAAGWQERHRVARGAVVHVFALAHGVACRDAFIALLDGQQFNPQAAIGTRWR